MKEMVEEYGGVILAALTGGIILARLVTGVRTDGGFRELLLLFFRGIGTEVACDDSNHRRIRKSCNGCSYDRAFDRNTGLGKGLGF